MKLSTCCDELPSFELQDDEDGICSGCGEHSEFYHDEGCENCGGELKMRRFMKERYMECQSCGEIIREQDL